MKSVNALGARQLFFMKKMNLLKRVEQFFEQTNNAAAVVEYLVAILLRDALCVKDYSINELTDLIHHLFLTTEPNNTLRQHAIYFKKFFSEKEWSIIMERLFQNETEYRTFTRETCLYNELLEKRTLKKVEPSNYQFKLVSTFTDAQGKKHVWTLRDTKEIPEGAVREAAEVAELLTMLTTLSIFQTANGTQRFVKYVKYVSESGKIDITHAAEAVSPKTEKSVQVPASASNQTPTPQSSSIHTNKPKKSARSAANSTNKNKMTYDQLMDKAEAMYQLSQAAPQTEPKSCSAASNPAATEKAPPENSAESPLFTDTSYLRYGKNEEQIKTNREKKIWNNKVNKEQKRKGKGGKGSSRKKKGKKKK